MSKYDVIIIGGSFAGLAAAMALGRSMREVLVIDAGEPCNRSAPQAHNLVTHDGRRPAEIAAIAKRELEKYPTIHFINGFVETISGASSGFRITLPGQQDLSSKKIILATGIRDILPDLEGFKACWGISVIHCPYCHGFEFKNEGTAIMASGEVAFELSKMIRHWTSALTVVTNGETGLPDEQSSQLAQVGIQVISKPVIRILHKNGEATGIEFNDKVVLPVKAIYARPAMQQHNNLAEQLGCAMKDHLVAVDEFQRTSVPGVYAAGDNSYMMRSLAASIAAGTKAGALADRELIMESFKVHTESAT